MLNGENIDISLGGNFDPVPSGKYTVQIVDVNSVRQFNKFKSEEEVRLNYKYAILDDIEMQDPDGETTSTRGRFIWHRVSPSLGNKAWLRKLAIAAFGGTIPAEMMDEKNKNTDKFFHPEKLIGMQVTVLVSNSESNGRIFNNIKEYEVAKKPLKILSPLELGQREGDRSDTVVRGASQPVTQSNFQNPPEVENDQIDQVLADIEQEQAVKAQGANVVASAAAETDEVAELQAKLAAAQAKAKQVTS